MTSHNFSYKESKSTTSTYRLFFLNNPDPVFITNSSGKIIETNTSAERTFGYTLEEFSSMDLSNLIAEEPKTIHSFQTALKESETVSLELKMKKKDGTVIPVEIKRGLIEQINSDYTAYTIVKDLTELKIRQMLIKEASDFGKVILKSAPVGIAAYNNLGNCIVVNEAFAGIIGASKTEVLRQNIHSILSWKRYGLYELAIEAIEKEKPVRKEIFIKTTFGKAVWLDLTFSTVKVNNETHLLMIIDDITGRKNAEELLKKSEEKFRSSVELMIDPFAIFEAVRNPDGKIINFVIRFINKAGVNIISRNSGNISAHSLLEFFMQQANADIFPEICRVVESGESLTRESVVYDSSGKNIEYAVIINAVKLDDGVVINWRDMTEHKIVEKELSELNINKDKLFSIIAHDLRSPFHSIMGMTELLYEDLESFSGEEKKELFKATNQHVKLVLQLLEDLLQWAGNQNNFSFAPTSFNLIELLNKEVEVFRPTAKEKAISIKFNPSLPGIDVVADKKMIGTVIRNLISNAIKFSYPGGDISIVLTIIDEKIKVSVIDKGLGISKEHISKILDIGVKYTTMGTNKERGTGFGLILVKDLLEKNNSQIIIESIPGAGSNFSFELPIKKV